MHRREDGAKEFDMQRANYARTLRHAEGEKGKASPHSLLFIPLDLRAAIPIVVVNRHARHGFIVGEGVFARRFIYLRS
jgi:hypothetical protein